MKKIQILLSLKCWTLNNLYCNKNIFIFISFLLCQKNLQDLVQTRKHDPYWANLVESPKHCVVMKRRTMPKNNSQKKRCSSEGHNCLHPVYPHHYALYTDCWSLLFTYTYFLHLKKDNVRNYYKGLVTEAMAFYFHLKWHTFLGEREANLKSWNSTHSTE